MPRATTSWSAAIHVLRWGLAVAVLTAAPPGRAGPGAEKALVQCNDLLESDRAEEALPRCEEAVAIARREGDRKVEGRSLMALGGARYFLGRYEEAIENGKQAVAIAREANDREGEAEAYGAVGAFLEEQGRFDEALRYDQLALETTRDVGKHENEVEFLNNLGVVQLDLSRYPEAMASFEEALRISRGRKDLSGEAAVLANLAGAWRYLGNYRTSLEYSEQSLTISRELGERRREARALISVAGTRARLGEDELALSFYEQAQALSRQLKDRNEEAVCLRRSGEVLEKLARYEEAADRYRRMLAIVRELKELPDEGRALDGLGSAYRHLDRREEALALHQDALVVLRESKDPEDQARALRELMLTWGSLGRRAPAIFLGKLAVNAIERVRTGMAALDRDAQRGYLQTMETTYRALAELLLAEGRLPEAEQVLGLLKDQEYGAAFQGAVPVEPARVTLTAREAAAADRYRTASAPLDALAEEFQAARQKRARTAEEERRIAELEARREEASAAFRAFVVHLPEALASGAAESPANAPEERPILAELRRLGRGAVAIYTLSAPDRYHVVLVAPGRRVAREVPISAAQLAGRALAFRQVLQDTTRDPVPQAQEMYRLLLGPIQRDLEAAGATTLLWSLDGPLRYLPVAALHDGKGWLVERYRNALLTPASPARRAGPAAGRLSAWGFGVSQAAPGFSALPGVEAELHDIIRSRGEKRGVLAGEVMLDQAFTREAFFGALDKQHRPVVHIASHFRFEPGRPAESFLVLGDGGRLTLQELAGYRKLFEGVEVVSLSACETAIEAGGEGAGREVEGFAALAQREGARAVLATLWPVEDQSTREVMAAFYRLRRDGKGKAEALRGAQLELLRGGARAGMTVARRSAVPAEIASRAGPAGERRHPYYWAPFVLSGDVR